MHPILEAAALGLRVQRVVDDVLARERSLLAGISDELAVIDETLVPFLSGGKRLRAAFCYWGWRGAGGNPDDVAADDAAMHLAASLEFLQACALIHDDVMDGSESRRGLPAVHHRFANLHRGQQWLGSPETFGVGAAILLGDLCLSWADETLMTADIEPRRLAAAKRVYDEMRTELIAGQYLDLQEQARGGGSVDRARKVMQFKSAKYTIERPMHIGAAAAGADAAIMAAYSAFGIPLGEAFQLRDDVLGVFGDPRITGKPAGDDLREGKRTVLVATALARADAVQQQFMREHLGDPMLEAVDIDCMRDIIESTGALAETEAFVERLLETALAAIDTDLVEPEARRMFIELADAATHRKG